MTLEPTSSGPVNRAVLSSLLGGATAIGLFVVLATVIILATLGILSLFASLIPESVRESDDFVKAVVLVAFIASAAATGFIRTKWGKRFPGGR
jgi:uncharacterized membrane protein